MSLYVLDTDHLSLYRYGHPEVSARIEATPADQLAVTIITIEVFVKDWKAHEGWGTLTTQPSEEGARRSVILSLLVDHCLFFHPAQHAQLILQQGFIGMNADAALEVLVVQRSRNAPLAHVAAGNFTTALGVKGRLSPPGHRSSWRSQSSWKALLRRAWLNRL